MDIIFGDQYLQGVHEEHDNPIVILDIITNVEVHKVIMDSRSSVDVIFYKCFKAPKFTKEELLDFETELVRFTGDRVSPKGYIEARITLGKNKNN